MKPLQFLALCAIVSAFGACTEVVTQHRADSSGHLRKVGAFVPEWGLVGKRLSYELDGTIFTYDLSAIPGETRGHHQPPTHLAPGEHFKPFHGVTDAPPFGAPGKTWFSGSIGWAADQSTKLSPQEIRFVNGRKWVVATKFEKGAGGVIKRRVFWTVQDKFLIALYVDFTEAPLDPQWRQKRLDMLARIVSGFDVRRRG
jgi:hypothetical protein